MTNGPVLIDLEDSGPTPASAPPVPDPDTPDGPAVQVVTQLPGVRPSRLVRWFWRLLTLLLAFALTLWAWDFAAGLYDRSLLLGRAALVLMGGVGYLALGLGMREWLALVRLRRLDRLRERVEAARQGTLADAQSVSRQLRALYRDRESLRWGLANFDAAQGEAVDPDTLLDLAEREILAPLDAAASHQVEAAARQVALITAIVPLALADVVTALLANLRMIRRVAEIYGGRAGLLGSWRLMRAVLAHLAATGAVAIGDDMVGSLAGGGILGKLSRRFGEGVVNGALTARVGVAAIEVCRPMPFAANSKPGVASIVKRALTGLFAG